MVLGELSRVLFYCSRNYLQILADLRVSQSHAAVLPPHVVRANYSSWRGTIVTGTITAKVVYDCSRRGGCVTTKPVRGEVQVRHVVSACRMPEHVEDKHIFIFSSKWSTKTEHS